MTRSPRTIRIEPIEEPHLPIAYHEGRFKPVEEATVNIMTHGFQYGIGCFAGLRAYYNEEEDQCFIFRLRDHCRRLAQSCRLLQCQVPETREEMESITREVAARNDYHGDTYLRPFVYSREHRLSPRTHDVKFAFAVYALPLKDYLDTRRGLQAMVSSWRRVDDDMIPARAKASGAYIGSALAKSEALRHGCDEAIFLNRDGHVAEGSSANLFLVRDGLLITPPVSDNILEGITRKSLLDLAERDLEIPSAVRPVDRSELYVCDEAFFAGTGAQVAWIREVDGRPVGDGRLGPITRRLKETYRQVVTGRLRHYRRWLTPVFGQAAAGPGALLDGPRLAGR